MAYIEKLESVNKEIVIEDEGLKITNDALLLAKFIKKIFLKKRENGKKALEIGAGQGIISILLSDLENISQIDAVEIQEKIFGYLEKNIKNNELTDKIIPIFSVVKEIEGEYDYIFSNPPYMKTNSGKMPNTEEEKISKYEITLNLEELTLEIKRLLKNGGEFFVIVPNDRLNDIFSYIYQNKLNILEIEINQYKKKDLVIIYGKKGEKKNSKIIIGLEKL